MNRPWLSKCSILMVAQPQQLRDILQPIIRRSTLYGRIPLYYLSILDLKSGLLTITIIPAINILEGGRPRYPKCSPSSQFFFFLYPATYPLKSNIGNINCYVRIEPPVNLGFYRPMIKYLNKSYTEVVKHLKLVYFLLVEYLKLF